MCKVGDVGVVKQVQTQEQTVDEETTDENRNSALIFEELHDWNRLNRTTSAGLCPTLVTIYESIMDKLLTH